MSENPDMGTVQCCGPVLVGDVRCPASGVSDVGFAGSVENLAFADAGWYGFGMPEGLVRWQREGSLHLVTISCDRRLPLLARVYDLALDALERTRVRYRMDVVGYVLMPEHVHLLVGEPEQGVLADAVKMFKLSVSLRQPHHPFWLKRYHDRNLYEHGAMIDCLRYLHRNPVKRGLVREPEDWPWSSYRHYYLREGSPIGLDSEWAFLQARWSPAP